ncbi:MAG: hypothetical protein MJZ05_07090 [Fibrobacter sp.]|nr:hypothetical protein [Fibrobacter sp.]
MSKNGLAVVRTGRLIASFNALLGMLFLLLNRVLTAVLEMANNAVSMGLARYNNFTGRFAADNFEEDKRLLSLLKEANELLPMADTALTILMFLSIVFIVIAVIGLVMPRNFVHILVALRLLEWSKGGEGRGKGRGGKEHSLSPTQKKIFLGGIGGVVFLLLACVGISSCMEEAEVQKKKNYVAEMQEQAMVYINAQKDFYAKNQKIGGPKSLQLPDSLETEAFVLKVTGSRFSAVSKVQIDSCAAGAKWQISSSVKGFFTQELQLYRQPPKDSACAALTPDFKNLGRVKPKTQP